MVDFRINETLQIGRRCFQLRRFNLPRNLCGAVAKPQLPEAKVPHLFLEFTIIHYNTVQVLWERAREYVTEHVF